MDGLTRLALEAGDGDRGALQEFVRLSQTEVWRFCAHLTSADEAEDLAQETFLRAVRALPKFRAESSARTWLLVIARRTCADHIRRVVRRRRLQRLIEHESGPLDAVVALDTSVEIDAAVECLEADRREAFVLTQVLGLPYQEAAEVCGCPIGTIRSRVARAREDLVRALGDGQQWADAAEA